MTGRLRAILTAGLRRIGATLLPAVSVVLAISPCLAHSMVEIAPIHPYERAYREAAIIVRGDIVAYDASRGATLRVQEVVRGDARAGLDYLLDGSAGYAFLASHPCNVVAFLSAREGGTLRLWQAPTSGGLILSEPGVFERIARAHADPRAALQSKDPRERLAGAYYRATGRTGDLAAKPTPAENEVMMDSIAWGMSHGSPGTHQAAVDTLAALGHSLETIGIAYHPLFKPELKQDAAAQLRAWWARRR